MDIISILKHAVDVNSMLAGAGIYGIFRELFGWYLKLRSAKLLADNKPENDAEAKVIADLADKMLDKK